MNQRRRAPRDRRYSVSLAVLVFVFAASFLQAQSEFIRGDANQDGRVSIADMVTSNRQQFVDGGLLDCMDALDFDDSGVIDISDLIALLAGLFVSSDWSEPVPAPFPRPGIDPTPDERKGITCESYEIVEGEASDDIIRLGVIEARPGEVVEVPIYLTNSVPVQATQLTLEYDSSVLEIESGNSLDYEGSFYEQFFGKTFTVVSTHGTTSSTFKYSDDGPGFSWVGPHPDIGVATIAIVGLPIYEGFEVPPGEGTLIASLRVRVSESATPGSIIPLALSNGPDDDGYGPFRMRNEITFKGETRYATLFPQTIPGQLNIIQDITFFTRGDCNADGKLDVTDPVVNLGFQFIGTFDPPCRDALDFNDNGVIDITDPIANLTHQFVGGPPPALPGKVCGVDPTDDDLGCGSFAECQG